MRVFLPHRESSHKLHNIASSSPQEDHSKRRLDENKEGGEELKIAAKKQRTQHTVSSPSKSDTRLKDPMGGGGKLYPVKNERGLLEIKKRSSEQNSDSNTTASVASIDGNASNVAGYTSTEDWLETANEASRFVARMNQNDSSNLSTCDDKQHVMNSNLKSECNNEEPVEELYHFENEGQNTISITSQWNTSSSPFASSQPIAAPGTSLYAMSSATVPSVAAAAKMVAEDEDPAFISKPTSFNDPSLSQYKHLLRTHHKPALEIIPMQGDGNCLFRAISLQVYGSEDMHSTVRTQCLDFMQGEETHFKDFVTESFRDYISRKRCDGVHGNHAEIQAASELYNRKIEVYVPPKVDPINIFQQEEEQTKISGISTMNHPIRLLYMDGNHYDALIDPLVPTAGLGLGLPGLEPGLADQLQLDQAKRESNQSIQTSMEYKMRLAMEESKRVQHEKEDEEIQRVLRESYVGVVGERSDREEVDDAFEKKAIFLSEMEAADFDLEQAALASSLETYQNAEQERKPASRRGESAGRRCWNNLSPNYTNKHNQRSSSHSPVNRTTTTSSDETAQCNDLSSSSLHYTSSYPHSTITTSAATRTVAAPVASFARARSASPTNHNDFGQNNSSATAAAHTSSDEYPQSVQELVMNGFQLSKVLHAYDLIGDNFDDLLAFLLASIS